MEHRCSPRIETDLHVLICQYNKPVAIGRIKDATAFGFYIESDWSTRPLQQLTLEVMDKQSHKLQKLQKNKLEAIVTHKTSRGFGVEIEVLTDEQAKELHDFLVAKPQRLTDSEVSIPQVVNG